MTDTPEAVMARAYENARYQGVEGMQAAIAALRAAGYVIVQDWKPIESAPRDGTPILVFGGRYKTVSMVEADGGWWNSAPLPGATPTHWRPRPAPPAEDSGE